MNNFEKAVHLLVFVTCLLFFDAKLIAIKMLPGLFFLKLVNQMFFNNSIYEAFRLLFEWNNSTHG